MCELYNLFTLGCNTYKRKDSQLYAVISKTLLNNEKLSEELFIMVKEITTLIESI